MSLEEIGFAVPGALGTRTGGYGYDRRLIEELRSRGWVIRHLAWPDEFPYPDATALDAVARSLAGQPDDSTVIIDGLAYGAIPALAGAEGKRLRLIALVHHPLALETDALPGLYDSECQALRHARAVIATSEATAETLRSRYDVPAYRIVVAPPGTDPSPLARRGGDPLHLLSVGTVTPRKGHDVLVDALAQIRDLPWLCTIVGSHERSPATVRALRLQIAAEGLAARIALPGEVDDVTALYENADLFVLASRHEGYGMAYAEALARGLPVIGTLVGATPAVVPAAAGALVPPDDPWVLAKALRHLLVHSAVREQAAMVARRIGEALPEWNLAADRVAALLRETS